MSKPQTPKPDTAPEASPQDPVVLLLTTFPDRERAEAAARGWVEAGLAACVHIAPVGRSIYRWQGVVESAEEVQVTVKTTADHLEALGEALQKAHPYELPELLLVSPDGGSGAYLDWVRLACQPDTRSAAS